MFDVGFSELVVIGVVALVVVGPERLPKVARTAGHLFGRLQRYVATVKTDIQREMDAADLGKLKTEVQDAARAIEQSVQQHAQDVEAQAQALHGEINESTTEAPHAAIPAPEPEGAPGSAATPEPVQQQLDLAIGNPDEHPAADAPATTSATQPKQIG